MSTEKYDDLGIWNDPPEFAPKSGGCSDLPVGHRCHCCCCWKRSGRCANLIQIVFWLPMFLLCFPIVLLSNLVIWMFVYTCRGGAVGVAKNGTQPYCKTHYTFCSSTQYKKYLKLLPPVLLVFLSGLWPFFLPLSFLTFT
jgi:hypothetical protein